jgi:hypothetical protein
MSRPSSATRNRLASALAQDAEIGALCESERVGDTGDTLSRGTFASVEALNEWLLLHGVSTSKWGKLGLSKSVTSLFDELESEECVISKSPVLRVVRMCRGKVYRPRSDKILLETHQQLAGGRIRPMNQVTMCSCCWVHSDTLIWL